MTPNKNRLAQVRRTGGRKLFDRKRKEVFLEWFAATCNNRLSAGKAGVNEKTVYKHLMKDAAFEEAWFRALRLGYARLEARQLQEALRLGVGPSGTSSEGPLDHPADGPPPRPAKAGREEYRVGILDDELFEEHFDPQLALQLLREHRRHLPGSTAKRPAQRTAAQTASSKEIADALAKRLKAFALRVQNSSPERGGGRPAERD